MSATRCRFRKMKEKKQKILGQSPRIFWEDCSLPSRNVTVAVLRCEFYSVTVSASGAFFFTLSIPLRHASLELYTSDVAITWPLVALRSNLKPVATSLSTNFHIFLFPFSFCKNKEPTNEFLAFHNIRFWLWGWDFLLPGRKYSRFGCGSPRCSLFSPFSSSLLPPPAALGLEAHDLLRRSWKNRPRRKKDRHPYGCLSFLVAGMGFEPHDLRVMRRKIIRFFLEI